MTTVDLRELRGLFGALILGFVFFLLINYLSLFEVIQSPSLFNQEWLLISVGVIIGYGVAWASS